MNETGRSQIGGTPQPTLSVGFRHVSKPLRASFRYRVKGVVSAEPPLAPGLVRSQMDGTGLSQIDGTPHQGLPTRTRPRRRCLHNWQLWETGNIDVPGRHFTTYDH